MLGGWSLCSRGAKNGTIDCYHRQADEMIAGLIYSYIFQHILEIDHILGRVVSVATAIRYASLRGRRPGSN